MTRFFLPLVNVRILHSLKVQKIAFYNPKHMYNMISNCLSKLTVEKLKLVIKTYCWKVQIGYQNLLLECLNWLSKLTVGKFKLVIETYCWKVQINYQN